LKTKLGLYKIWKTNLINKDDFYQFILDTKDVKTSVEKYGFELVLKRPLALLKD